MARRRAYRRRFTFVLNGAKLAMLEAERRSSDGPIVDMSLPRPMSEAGLRAGWENSKEEGHEEQEKQEEQKDYIENFPVPCCDGGY